MTPFITRLGFRAGALCSHQGGHVLNLHYRVIQRDCHKWKCYQITLNQDFIDFWGIFRFHILGDSLFKATLDPNRHFWLLWPIFWCPIVFEGYFVDFFQKHKFGSFTVFLYGSSNVGQSQLIFVWPNWCRQVSLFADRTLGNFPFWGAHLQKGLKSNLSGRKQSTEQLNGHFPEKQRHSKICQDTGVICSHRICDFRDHKMGTI